MPGLLRAKLFSQGTKKVSNPTPAKHTLTADDTITGATINSAERNAQRTKDLTVRQGYRDDVRFAYRFNSVCSSN